MLDVVAQHALVRYLGLVTLALSALLLAYRSISREVTIRSKGGHAPIARGRPGLFGVDHVYKFVKAGWEHKNIQNWDRIFMKHGHPSNPYTVEVYTGWLRVVLTADPENIKAILATQFDDYGKGAQFNKDWHLFLGDSIFSTDHEKWHQSRQLIRPQFIKERVSDLETFEKHVRILIPLLKGQGQEVDVKDLFFRYTLDAATDFLLGRSTESLAEGKTEFAWAFSEIQRIQNMVSRAGPFKFIIDQKEFHTHLETLNSFVEPYIEDALRLSQDELAERSKKDQGYTFLHAVASFTRDRKVLRDQLVAVLLAGRDTTACTLSWLFYEISKKPELVNALRLEIEQQVGLEHPPTYEDLKSMQCLQYTLNETLRLYPVVPYNVRLALRDTTLPRGGGKDGKSPIGILKGTPVVYSAHYLQLRKDLYPTISKDFSDPLTFDPRRWNKWQPKPWTYIPFNGGPRICVGQQFALTEMGYTVVRILQSFSRIETRVPRKSHGVQRQPATFAGNITRESEDGDFGGVRHFADSRDLPYRSEIVLQPLDSVLVAFWE